MHAPTCGTGWGLDCFRAGALESMFFVRLQDCPLDLGSRFVCQSEQVLAVAIMALYPDGSLSQARPTGHIR